MDSFSKPLSRFADHFIETWEVHDDLFVRSFQQAPKNFGGRLMLWIVRPSLKRAVRAQTEEMVRQ